MRTAATGLLFLSALAIPTWGNDDPDDNSPVNQYKALREELDRAVLAREKAVRLAKTDEERRRIPWPPDQFGGRFLDLARRYPKSPVAFDSLRWIISREVYPEAHDAIEILRRNYVLEEEVATACPDLESYTYLEKAEDSLRQIVARNPSRRTRGIACLSLARFLKGKAKFVRGLEDGPEGDEQEREIEKEFGAEYLNRLKSTDPDKLLEESDSLFERVAVQYADVEIEDKSLGKLAQAELFERRELVSGRMAPEIQGLDLDGERLKLSDYRGKVVVLDFWSHELCGACRQMYPHQREMVKRLAGKPFALLGVNNDSDRGKIRAVMEREGLDWRAWWDPGDPFGPISERWNIQSWPTVYVLDHRGVIRFKNVHGHDLDEAVDGLLKERMSETQSRP